MRVTPVSLAVVVALAQFVSAATPCYPEWSSSVQDYILGSVASFKNNNFVVQSTGWALQGPCDSLAPKVCYFTSWSPTGNYTDLQQISYQNFNYILEQDSWNFAGPCDPTSSPPPVISGIPPSKTTTVAIASSVATLSKPTPSPIYTNSVPAMPPMWAGVNSYFLYSLPESDQETILSALADAGVKTVRIFLTSFSPGGKGTTARGSTDLELDTCGDYNDSVLDQVDAMLPLLSKHGIRLLIAMHDRWNLDGTWGICDAYCQKYMGGSGKDLRAFYASEEAQAQFDKRLAHVARYESKTMGGRAWMDLPEVIYALEIQNEGQGTSNGIDQFSNPDWWCGRATALRAVMGDSQVKISTGGGQDFGHSILDNNFACKALDVIALHSYESDMGTIQKNLADAQNKAQAQGQVIIFEEFGVQGGKADFIAKVGALANSMGIPWMPWEVSNPSAKSDYEFWMDDSETWSALTKYAKAAVGSY